MSSKLRFPFIPFLLLLIGLPSATAVAQSVTLPSAPDGVANAYILRVDRGTLELRDTRANTLLDLSAAKSGETLVIEGSDSDDVLTVDFSGGNPIPAGGLVFHGNGQVTARGDLLITTGGTFTDVAYTPGPTADAGRIDYDGVATITFTGLEPVESLTVVATLTINATSGMDVINVIDGPVSTGNDPITGIPEETYEVNFNGALELIRFRNATNVVVNAGGNDDDVTINIATGPSTPDALDTVTINGGNGNDTFSVGGTKPDGLLKIDGGILVNTLDFNAATALSGDLEILSATVTQSVPISVGGTLTLTLGVDDATLDDAGNDFATVVVTSGDAVSLNDGDGYDLGASSTTTSLTVESAGPVTQSAPIGGTGALVYDGTDTFTLSEANTYTGATTVNAGTLLVDGSTAAASTVAVEAGATLGGMGAVGGAVNVASGGTVAPGASPEVLGTGDVAFTAGAVFDVEVNGLTPGPDPGGHDQLDVTGTVDLGGATLALSAGFTPAAGDAVTIINNDGADAITGTFAGIAEGGTVTDGGVTYTVSYVGGDGNDVVLSALLPEITATKTDALLVDEDEDGQADPGDTVRYTIVITNTGAEATGVFFDDTPDANTTLVVGSVTTTQGTVTSGNTAGDTSVSVDIGTLAGDEGPPSGADGDGAPAGAFGTLAGVDEVVTITFDVTINVPFPISVEQVSNQGTVSGEDFADVPTDDPDTPAAGDATVTPVSSTADLELAKTASTTSPDLGADVVFTLTVTNQGPVDPATGVQVKDVLPEGLLYVSDDGGGAYNPGTGVWTVGNVALATPATLSITARVETIEPVTNTAEITEATLPDPDSTPADGTGDDFSAVTLTPTASDLDVDKTLIAFSEDRSVVTATFLVAVTNLGPSPATGVEVTDVLPEGVTLTGTFFSDPSDTYDAVTGVWTVGDLAVDETATLAMSVTADATIQIFNTAAVTASDQPDPFTRNNVAATNLGRQLPDLARFRADVSLTKTVDNANPAPGDEIVYTLTVSNGGPLTTAGVEVTDVLPEGLEFVGATASTTTDRCPACRYDDTRGVWVVGGLRKGTTATLQITARVVGTGEIVNVAEVTGGNLPDPDSRVGNGLAAEDDQDSATVTVQSGSQPKAAATTASSGVPVRVELGQNYPNPFNPVTTIPFGVPEASHVRVAVYDLLGREVAVLVNGVLGAGRYEAVWEASNHPTGMYLVRMEAAGVVQTRRVTLMR